ncbi:hypothetical protein KYB31_10570 [Clostridium felsineum]|uniref:hypothetical protein n=1 Tax=Clostridium felsineum TaxID=36839 RepID=UPI00214DC5B0|nr:hypothetical protein [Clostridium felsineum]MCR3759427.1 hypothetical protein [Clostridium felsineum]
MYKLLIVHLLICLIFYIYLRKNKNSLEKVIYKIVMVLLIPIFGFAYFGIIYILDKRKYKDENVLSDYEEYIKNTISSANLKINNLKKERNLVPISEAFILNSNSVKRELIINIVKSNPLKHIDILEKALENEDTEVSHYAASAITELKSYFMENIQRETVKYEKDKENIEVLISYLNTIKQYIDSGFLEGRQLKKYEQLYSDKLEELLAKYKVEARYFIEKINLDIKLEDFNSARRYCKIFYENYKDDEEPYIMFMKIFYILRDQVSFSRALDNLMNSNIRFSNEALNMVRFWIAGEKNER